MNYTIIMYMYICRYDLNYTYVKHVITIINKANVMTLYFIICTCKYNIISVGHA